MQGSVDEPHVDKHRKHAVEDSAFRPPVCLRVYGVSLAELFREAPPVAAVFRDMQQRVQKLQVFVLDVPSLHWEQVLDPLELNSSDVISCLKN